MGKRRWRERCSGAVVGEISNGCILPKKKQIMEEIEKERKEVNRRIVKYFFLFRFFSRKSAFLFDCCCNLLQYSFPEANFLFLNCGLLFFPNDVIPWPACLRLLVEWASRQGRISFLPFLFHMVFRVVFLWGRRKSILARRMFKYLAHKTELLSLDTRSKR
jgi:hypothetical protein